MDNKYMKMFNDFILNESDFNKYTGKEVAKHIIDITPDDSNIPDYFIDKYIKPNDNWVLKLVDLKDLLETDESFVEYYNSKEQRYNEDEFNEDDLEQEIVVYKGILLDGYSRVSTMLNNGDDKTYGYVLE